jgi:hypothetical protein
MVNGSSGAFGIQVIGGNYPVTQYLILSNPDAYSKDVYYHVSHKWTYDNNFASITGIALITVVAIVLFLGLLKDKLRDFNKALENQE